MKRFVILATLLFATLPLYAADTARDQTDVLALFADGQGVDEISPQDMRDFIVSILPGTKTEGRLLRFGASEAVGQTASSEDSDGNLTTDLNLPVNAQTGTTYTVLATDHGKNLTHTNGAATAVTLPQATGDFADGFWFIAQNKGAGTVTYTPTTSTLAGGATLALTTSQWGIIASDGTNYDFHGVRLVAGTGIAITPATGGFTVAVGSTVLTTTNPASVSGKEFYDTPLVAQNAFSLEVPNDVTNPATVNHLAKIQADGGTGVEARIAETTDQDKLLWPVVSIDTAPIPDDARLAVPGGEIDMDFDAATTVGYYVVASDSVAGEVSAEATEPESGWVLGRVTEDIGAAGLAYMKFDPYPVRGSTVGSIGLTVDGAGAVVSTGVKGCVEIPFSGTITRATLIADQSGTATVDVWLDTYANYKPDNDDSICDAGTCLALAGPAIKAQDSTLTNWTTTVTAGDIACLQVDAAATVTWLALSLKVIKD